MPISKPFSIESALPVSKVSEVLRAAMVSPFALFRSRVDFPVAGYVKTDG
jgi:hypothetical protein